MMKIQNKTLFIFILFDVLFLACACILIVIPILGRRSLAAGPTLQTVAQVLLLDECPLTAAIINGVFMLVTVAISLPGILLKRNRTFLTVHAWLLVLNAIFTLAVGLSIWFETLQTKANLAPIWARNPDAQKLLQLKFQCCGYNDVTTFLVDGVCTSAAVAASKGTCVIPFSAFANNFLDVVFTSLFGFCAVDGLLLLSGLCVLKDRAEKARYELIDEKRNYSNYSYGRL